MPPGCRADGVRRSRDKLSESSWFSPETAEPTEPTEPTEPGPDGTQIKP